MVGNEQKVIALQNFYEIMDGLQPTMKVHERTEDIVTRVAEVIRKCGFLVKYDSQTAPMIDAAVLRFSWFDHERYFLFVGAAFSIVKAEHPDWIYETFIECFRKDVVDLMAERAEDYMGYKAFADEKG